MRTTLALHILAGMLGLVSGFIALYAAKGGWLHRKSGRLFVSAMLLMALGGFVMAVGLHVAPGINVPAALLTAYLVTTALITVRPPSVAMRRFEFVAMGLALALGMACMVLGFQAVASASRAARGMAYPLFMFGSVALIGSAGDLRMIRGGSLRGAPRLARHLWRMCFALFIAALSFFVGQADVFPAAIRIRPLLALPVLTVLVTMFYWLWRVRGKRAKQGLVGLITQEAMS